MTSASPTQTPLPAIGLIGLGLMGSALAERLLGAGQRVVGWDIDPGRAAALRENGGEVAGDAQDVFASCRRVLLSLPSHREVADVIQAAGAILSRGVTIMVGGDVNAFTAASDIFDAIGRQTFHTGPAGTGAKMKLVTNLVLGLNRAALAEGLIQKIGRAHV